MVWYIVMSFPLQFDSVKHLPPACQSCLTLSREIGENMRMAATRPQVREALLAAARAELVEHGRAAITLRAVARRAGLSHASPKYHFGDRSGLLTAIATEGFHALAHRLSEVHESDARTHRGAAAGYRRSDHRGEPVGGYRHDDTGTSQAGPDQLGARARPRGTDP